MEQRFGRLVKGTSGQSRSVRKLSCLFDDVI
jgi:hypothetical protein